MIPTIAICYDFDKTLSPKNMQEWDFIRDIGYTVDNFWAKQDFLIDKYKADMLLVNMYNSVVEAGKAGIELNRNKLHEYGRKIQLFPGVETWFERINEYGKEIGVNVEHYIVSSGWKEMIEGTSIAKYFKKIYACSFIYDEEGKPIWPALCVNFTNKTQFLYRINKGCLDENDLSVNEYLDHDSRFVPFENMIYLGDSETDIPCMSLVMKKGGKSIGIYETSKHKKFLKELLANNRINYIAKADYSKGEQIETIVKAIIKSIKINHSLKNLSKVQKNKIS